MGWARLDDSFHDHPKLIGLSLEALGLWTKCFTWAHRHHGSSAVLGHLPDGLAQTFAGTRAPKLIAELVGHRLWDIEETLGGWTIHDYIDYLPASERPTTANGVRKSRSEAGKRGANARWSKANDSQTDGKLLSDVDGKAMPPTRPDPIATTTDAVVASASRGTRIPQPFIVTADMREWAARRVPGVNVDSATEKFVNYWRAKTRDATKKDWRGTWDNWLITDFERMPTAKPTKEAQVLDVLEMGRRMQAADDQKAVTA